jgi:hypothetical protein
MGKGLQLDAESESFLLRKGGADLGPSLAGVAIALELFDGKDVEVSEGGSLGAVADRG